MWPFRRQLWTAFATVIVILLTACESKHDVKGPPTPSVTASHTSNAPVLLPAASAPLALGNLDVDAPDFPPGLQWLNVEQPLSIHRDLAGKIILLDFWTLGCINCQDIIPDEKQLEAEFGDALVIVGVHSGKYSAEKGIEAVRSAVERLGLQHPVVNDPEFQVWQAYGVRAWPTLVLIDPIGKLHTWFVGEGVYTVFAPIIRSLVAEYGQSGQLDRAPVAVKLSGASAQDPSPFAPGKVLADAVGKRLFIADAEHNRILVADLQTGGPRIVIGGGPPGLQDGVFSVAQFRGPEGMALSPDGKQLYVADTLNHAIRLVDLTSGYVKTIAGDGRQAVAYPSGRPAVETQLSSPWDLLVWQNTLFIASAGTHQIWTMDLNTKTVKLFAGSGAEGILDADRHIATLAQPEGLATDGRYLYWIDAESSSLRRTRLDGSSVVETLVGTGLFDFGDADGTGRDAQLQHPEGLTYAAGKLYVADTYNHQVRVVDTRTSDVRTLDNAADTASFTDLMEPTSVSVAAGHLYVADRSSHAVRACDLRACKLTPMNIGQIGTAESSVAPATDAKVKLPVQTSGPGTGTIALTVTVPNGYHLNNLAPALLEVMGNDATSVVKFQVRSIAWQPDESQTSVQLPVQLSPGRTTLALAATLYYCRTGLEALCFVKRVTFIMPVAVTRAATSGGFRVYYQLPTPITPY